MSEHSEQAALMQWAAFSEARYPELRLLFAIPNGAARDKITGAMLKREGVRAGVPDLCLPCARRGYHGLFIELKVGRNRPAEKQAAWLDALTQAGYLAVACWGWCEAREVIEEYLASPQHTPQP
jgi:hypothetical protein